MAPLPPPHFYLREDEPVLLRVGAATGHAYALFGRSMAPLVVITAAAVAAALLLEPVPDLVAGIVRGVFALAMPLMALVSRKRQRAAEYVVTQRRVYARQGRVFTRVHLTTHDRITDMRYRQGPVERRLGIESLSVMTAGGDIMLEGLADARAMRETIEGAREALVDRLLHDAGARVVEPTRPPTRARPEDAEAPETEVAPPPEPLPSPPFVSPGDHTRWIGRPRPIASLGALRSIVGALPIAAFVFLTRDFRAGVTVSIVLVGIALMIVGARLAQLRRAQYAATDARIYARTGVFGTTLVQLTYDKITDITYKQDVLGRALGYGSLTLSTAGGAPPIQLQGLRDALAAKEDIERLRARYLREEDQ